MKLCGWLCLFALATAHAEENPLAVDAAAQTRLGIVVEEVQVRALTEEIRAPGEVQANAYATTLVASRIAAHVVRRQARLGDDVGGGQPLITLSSVEVAAAQGALIVAERDWQRVRALGADAVSGKRYTEAQVARDQAHAKLRAFGLAEDEIAALLKLGSARATGDFALVAPQAGRITTDAFIVGERVEPGRTLYTIVDERRVWIEAQLAPATAARIAPDALGRVTAHGTSRTGTVVQLAHRTQESSRTTPVRLEVANDGDVLHPGELVDVFIATTSAAPALAVPTDAIVQIQGQAAVFRLAGDRFDVAPIQPGEQRGALTVVRQGLAAGDRIAVHGAYALKARLLKSQLGDGHD